MRDCVREEWCKFNTPLEGWTTWMYLDVKGLVTTGMGNLIDPVSVALTLPWQDKRTGQPATQAAIQHEWQLVKGNLALVHDLPSVAAGITNLRLEDADLANLILDKLDRNEAILKAYGAFSDFEEWPADAQLGLLSMAWAMGPGFGPNFPHFSQAIAAEDFSTAAGDCAMDTTGNAGLNRRNAADRQAFLYAVSCADPNSLQSAVPPF